jgi:ribose-phosphate pyrophosphokinase
MKVKINGYEQNIKTSTFPGGEEYVSLPAHKHLPRDPKSIEVTTLIKSSADVMNLLLITDALRRYTFYKAAHSCAFILDLGYLPYARQDRVCAEGESFSLKVFAELINNLKYDEVIIDDCHSDVGIALLNNLNHHTQLDGMKSIPNGHNRGIECDVIIAPDAGAAKKAQTIADYYGKPLVQCLKTRNTDGTISIQCLGDIKDKKCLVVDDICDGGGTFIALAEALENSATDTIAKELNLYVTHGIFSKGKEVLLQHYNRVEALYDWTKV